MIIAMLSPWADCLCLLSVLVSRSQQPRGSLRTASHRIGCWRHSSRGSRVLLRLLRLLRLLLLLFPLPTLSLHRRRRGAENSWKSAAGRRLSSCRRDLARTWTRRASRRRQVSRNESR